MLDTFKWECTINETCQEHSPWKYSILSKKKKNNNNNNNKITSPLLFVYFILNDIS